jgi:hypothetical protein
MTHRECHATMVLLYVAVVFVVTLWPSVNRVHRTLEFACECMVSALAGSLVGAFLGIAWDHPTLLRVEVGFATPLRNRSRLITLLVGSQIAIRS